MRPLDRPLALIGLMGAGKTSVAQCLGERLAVPVADLDAWVEAEAGLTIAELFDAEGEPSFRRRERRARVVRQSSHRGFRGPPVL